MADGRLRLAPLPTARVLIVARRTSSSVALVAAVARRAREGRCVFTLLVPSSLPNLGGLESTRCLRDLDAERRIAAAVPLLSRAAGSEVVAVVGAHKPFLAARDAIELMGFDEVIVSMLPARQSIWLRQSVPARIRSLGVQVTEVVASGPPVAPRPAA